MFDYLFLNFKATSNASEMKRLQAGDIDYKEAMAASAIRNKIEVDGIKAERNAAVLKVGQKIYKWNSCSNRAKSNLNTKTFDLHASLHDIQFE